MTIKRSEHALCCLHGLRVCSHNNVGFSVFMQKNNNLKYGFLLVLLLKYAYLRNTRLLMFVKDFKFSSVTQAKGRLVSFYLIFHATLHFHCQI